MTERRVALPLLENGQPRIVCNTCQARTRLEDGFYCVKSKLATRPPFLCPLRADVIDPYRALRNQLNQ